MKIYFMIKELTTQIYNIIIIKLNDGRDDPTYTPSVISMDIEPRTADSVGVEFAI